MKPWIAIPTFIATAVWIGVVVLYWVRAKWWRGAIGWNTMGISITLAGTLLRLTLLQAGVVFSPVGNVIFGLAVYLGLAVFGAQRFYLIWDSQKRKARELAAGNLNRRWDDPK